MENWKWTIWNFYIIILHARVFQGHIFCILKISCNFDRVQILIFFKYELLDGLLNDPTQYLTHGKKFSNLVIVFTYFLHRIVTTISSARKTAFSQKIFGVKTRWGSNLVGLFFLLLSLYLFPILCLLYSFMFMLLLL